MRVPSRPHLEIGLAALVLLVGVAVALSTLGRGFWLDEFWTLASSRREHTGAEFFELMRREVHPPLHYWLIQLAQWAGLTDPFALRALNLLAIPIVLWACWLAHRDGALSRQQGVVLIALYASSAMFLDVFAELRGYFLLFSLSVSLALVWRVLARRARENLPWTPAVLGLWFFLLLLFVNLHYFAVPLGGLLTLALLWRRRDRSGLALAALSAAAAAPMLYFLALQAPYMQDGLIAWIRTGRIDAAFVIGDSIVSAAAFNLIAIGCACVALLIAAQNRDWRDMRDEVLLAGVLGAYFVVLILINAYRPVIVDRYLAAGGGAVAVLVALLAANSRAPAWGAVAACVFALAAQARALHTQAYIHPGWEASADAVAAEVASCPSARVFIDPVGDLDGVAMLTASRRYGLEFYAARKGLSVTEIGPGARLPPPGECPNLIWVEHFPAPPNADGADLLARFNLEAEGRAKLVRAGTGVVLIVHGQNDAPAG